VGVYVFGPRIFEAIRKIKPSARDELEITEAIQQLIDDGGSVGVEQVSGWWKDTGRPEDLLEANQLILSGFGRSQIGSSLSSDTNLTGNVVIADGCSFTGNVRIVGPVTIGNNCKIGPEVYIGPYTSIGDNSTLDHTEIENSIIMNGVSLQSGKRISQSLIGSFSTIRSGEISLPKGYRLIVGERSFVQI
jgi:glucose-1-phosphate thymidylyltransferase